MVFNRRAAVRNRALPGVLSKHFDEETFARSRAYTLDQLAFAKVSLFYSGVITVVLLFSGILPWIDGRFQGVFGLSLHRGVLFLAGVSLIQGALKLPMTLYSTFRIEGKYGFNTMTWGVFWVDLGKEVLLSLCLGIPFLYAVLGFMAYAGSLWWAWVFLFIVAFQLIMVLVYPVFIAPLFNKFKPLEEGGLKSSLLALAARLSFPARGIFVMDGSRRSLHSNAYFTGFGKLRRIVLFDTLLRQMDDRELSGIVAHEIGHYRLKHVYKMLIAQVIAMGFLLYLLSWAVVWPPLYTAFGYGEPSPGAGLFLSLAVFSSLSILLTPIRNWFSRKHEYEADAFAVKACGDPEAMQSALIKLSKKNLSNLTPHPWYSFFHYSHPTLAERLKAIQV